MFKRLGILAILVVMALMVSVPAVSAQGGPPEHVERGQALVTGSVWVQQTGVFDPSTLGPGEPMFPPQYRDVEDGPISRFVFNARMGTELVKHTAFPPEIAPDVYEAEGHLFWFKGDEVIRVDIVHMLPDGMGWWHVDIDNEYYIENLRCNYISGIVVSEHYPPHYGMCFVVCDLPEPFVYVASIHMGDMYRFDVLRGNVIIKE